MQGVHLLEMRKQLYTSYSNAMEVNPNQIKLVYLEQLREDPKAVLSELLKALPGDVLSRCNDFEETFDPGTRKPYRNSIQIHFNQFTSLYI